MRRSPERRTRRLGRVLGAALVAVLAVAAVLIAVRPSLLRLSSTDTPTAAAPAPSTGPVVVLHDGGAAPAPGSRVVSAVPADGSRYFGVSVEKASAGADPSAAFTAATGVAPTLQMFFESFADSFDTTLARRITDAGRLPVVTWEPYDWRAPSADRYPLSAITAGRFDGYLRAEAERIASVPGPVVVRFAHEMNGDWYPWGVGVPGGSAAAYVAAYRHVHDVVTAAGATNVVWMWAPNLVDADPSIALAPLYPGDDVVDWVGLSGYFSATTSTFAARFDRTLTQVDAVAPTKPILLAETAVPQGTARARQIAELVDGVRALPRGIGLVWFDVAKREDWSVDGDPAGAAALGAAVRAGGFGARPRTVSG